MSQGNYIKYKRNAVVANLKTGFPSHSVYLSNTGFYLENTIQPTTPTYNQLQPSNTKRVFNMNLQTSTYASCITKSGALVCNPKSNYIIPMRAGIRNTAQCG